MHTEQNLMACPRCDALYRMPPLPEKTQAVCQRCSTVLATSRTDAAARVLALALTAMLLMLAALFFPFIGIRIGQTTNDTSVFGAIMAFADNRLFPVAVFMAALIILAPLLRALALIYALLPMVARRRPFLHAKSALRLAAALKPWSMTEVFIVGVAVSMVKIGGIASISFGPAFWAFTFLVVVTVVKDSLICEWSLWTALEQSR
jgi:paraquat-inducible protein A